MGHALYNPAVQKIIPPSPFCSTLPIFVKTVTPEERKFHLTPLIRNTRGAKVSSDPTYSTPLILTPLILTPLILTPLIRDPTYSRTQA